MRIPVCFPTSGAATRTVKRAAAGLFCLILSTPALSVPLSSQITYLLNPDADNVSIDSVPTRETIPALPLRQALLSDGTEGDGYAALMRRARMHYHLGEIESAQRLLREIRTALGEGLPDGYHLLLGEVLAAAGDHQASIASFARVEHDRTLRALADYNRGVLYASRDDQHNALCALWETTAVSRRDQSGKDLVDRALITNAVVRMRDGQLRRARRMVLRTHSDGAHSAEAMLVLGQINYERGNARAAARVWDNLAGSHPADPYSQEAWLLAGRAHLSSQRADLAQAVYLEASEDLEAEFATLQALREQIQGNQWHAALTAAARSVSTEATVRKLPLHHSDPLKQAWLDRLATDQVLIELGLLHAALAHSQPQGYARLQSSLAQAINRRADDVLEQAEIHLRNVLSQVYVDLADIENRPGAL